MKRLLSVLLILSMTVALFAGCSSDPATSGDPVIDPTPTPTESGSGDKSRPNYEDGSVIGFNLYNEGDYMTKWTDVAKEWMLNNYMLKVSASIPGIEGDMSTASSRLAYNTAIANLFIAESTRPDYMPALHGSAVGTDACFKTLGPEYLVDLNPYLEEGCLLESYVKWVWGGESKLGLWTDEEDYWYATKTALEIDGALYALPRRECMPVQNHLGYATTLLKQINVTEDELPTTWAGFVELLTKFKQYKNNSVPFVMYEGKLSNLMSFVASTYGLEFNEGFAWTQKNGEPLWTYYWDEYLQILKNVRELAAQELVKTDKSAGKGVVINHDFDYKKSSYKSYKSQSKTQAENGSSIAGYTTTTQFGVWSSDMRDQGGKTEWRITNKMITQDGKNASLYRKSQFDASETNESAGGYIAIGNRLGKEFALRIMDMLSYSMSDAGYISYFLGKEGTPFVDSVWDEEAGNLVLDENGKYRNWSDDRLGWAENKAFWVAQDKHAELLDDFPPDRTVPTYKNCASEYGITDTGFWPAQDNYKFGTMLQADVTSWPLKLTAYWSNESLYVDETNINAQMKQVESTGSMVAQGLYRTPTEYLGAAEASSYDRKISTLSTLAKEFTVGFLKGEKTEAHWDSYIKSLKDAGYNDVYEFYKISAYSFTGTYDPNVESQTTVNNKRN